MEIIAVSGQYKRVLKPNGKLATLDLFMKKGLEKGFVGEINKIMSNVIGIDIKIKTLQDWKDIYQKTEFRYIEINDYYEDIFKRSNTFSETIKITFKLLYHLITNKEIRQKVLPTLKFARKFQKAIKGDLFGYLIFIGIK